jgi:MFS transporter, MHS family, proline/betaine transporter
MRLLQGLSVGGEYVGSMSFLSAHAPPGRRAFMGSWSSFSTVFGTLLGTGTAALGTGLLSESQLSAWGWRLPFIGGILIGLLGLWLRLGVSESPSFLTNRNAGNLAVNPIAEALRDNRCAILTTFGLTGLSSVGYYLPLVWLPTWLSRINQPRLAEDKALTANTIALLVLLLLTPLSAVVSDRVGRKPMFLASALSYAVFAHPVFLMMTGGTFAGALLAGLVFASCNGLFSGCMGATMVELFPTRTRYSGIAIGYNLGQALLGGTAPLVATGLIDLTGNNMSPVFYLIASALVGGAASLFIKARHGQELDAPES